MAKRAVKTIEKTIGPKRGDVLAQVGPWTITCNEPGYSMLIQYQDGKQRFLSNDGAQALALATIEALKQV
jgi:hypothetical protein